ncbi:MAG: site-specific DNA-methyltransferase [Dermatophilaceae bacterium]|nr:site-specific DNA-methyltransferase [Dermatophilaceae bacterium]
MKPYYADESVTLYHGDCREVLPQLRVSVNSLITDPPYGLNIEYGRTALGTRGIAGDHDDALLTGILGDVRHVLTPNAWAAIFCGYTHSGKVQDAMAEAGFKVKTVVVWDKGMPSLGEGIRNQHELVVLAKRGRLPAERYTGGNVWRITRELGRPEHPHMKPQGLMTRLVDYYSPERGGTVLDPFAGSGSTLVAASRLGRKAIGIELDEAYCDLIVRRLSQRAFDFGGAG